MSPACYRHFLEARTVEREPVQLSDDAARQVFNRIMSAPRLVFEWIMSAPDLPTVR